MTDGRLDNVIAVSTWTRFLPWSPTFTVLSLLILGAPWWHGASNDVARYALAVIVLATAGVWIWHVPALSPALVAPALALTAWTAIQALFVSPAPFSTIESGILLVSSLSLIVMSAQLARDERIAKGIAVVVLFTCGAQGLFGVLQAALAPGHVHGRRLDEIQSPYGSFLNHNHFAGLLEMGVVLGVALAMGHVKRARAAEPPAIVLFGLSLGLAGAHLASRSRGGLLALLVGAAALVALWRLPSARNDEGRRRSTIVIAFAVIAILAFGLLAIPEASREHLATILRGSGDASGRYRLNTWAATLRLWTTHPVAGSGLGTYEDLVARHKQSDGLVRTAHAESDVLEFAAETGVLGVALAIWLGLAVVRGFMDRIRHGHDAIKKGLAVGALAAVIALLAHSFLDFNLRIPANALVFTMLAGLAAAPRTAPPRVLPAVWTRALAAGLLLLALMAAWRTVGAVELARAHRATDVFDRLERLSGIARRHPYLAEVHRERAHISWQLARGQSEMTAYRLRAAEDDLKRALRLRPAWPHTWVDLGWVQYMRGHNGAVSAFDHAVELAPADVTIGQARAEFHFRNGQRALGLQELRRIRRYNPDWPEAAAAAVAGRWNALK